MTNKSILIEAVRADVMVGRSTSTSIDECYSDDELFDDILSDCKTPEDAVTAAREQESFRLEIALNYRWGEDDDPEIIAFNAFHEKLKENS